MAGPVVILTGASSGIGAAIALELAQRHQARIALLARRMPQLEGVAEQVRAAGGEALPISCDVVDVEAVQSAVERSEAELGPTDVAIANAGVGAPVPMKRIDAQTINWIMRINFEGSTNLFAAVVPRMLGRGHGRIAGVSSIAGFRGLPRVGPYSASKAALTTMLESMRLELKPSGISVTTVHPGYVRTPMTDMNDFKMPFMVEADRAARLMVRGILKGKREVAFPWQMVWATRFARAAPDWLYDALVGGRKYRIEAEPDQN